MTLIGSLLLFFQVSDFVHNLEGVDSGGNFDPKLLKSIYKSIKKHEFEGGEDHVAQTQMIQASLVLAGSVSSGSGSSSSSNAGSGQKKSIPIQVWPLMPFCFVCLFCKRSLICLEEESELPPHQGGQYSQTVLSITRGPLKGFLMCPLRVFHFTSNGASESSEIQGHHQVCL